MVTTSFVFLECGNAAARRSYRTDVDDLRRAMSSHGRIIGPNSEDTEAAWSSYRNRAPGDASIVDFVSMVVMRRLGLTEVFANDRHFTRAGFSILF